MLSLEKVFFFVWNSGWNSCIFLRSTSSCCGGDLSSFMVGLGGWGFQELLHFGNWNVERNWDFNCRTACLNTLYSFSPVNKYDVYFCFISEKVS